MHAADEVNALVLDVGSLYVKGGYAGEDTPKALFPSVCVLATASHIDTVHSAAEEKAGAQSCSVLRRWLE